MTETTAYTGPFSASRTRLELCWRHISGRMVLSAVAAALALVVACGGDGEAKTMEVVVGPKRVECFGVGRMECLVVNGELFYDRIDGFEHEEGHSYRLRIETYDRWPDREEPPQDAGRFGYRLIDVISKTAQR